MFRPGSLFGIHDAPAIVLRARCVSSLRSVFVHCVLGSAICQIEAATIIDQAYTATTTGNTIIAARFNTAQTFTVGLTGLMTSVDVLIGQTNNPSGAPLILDIRATTVGGVPTESDAGPNVFGSLTLPAAVIPTSDGTNFGWMTFDVEDFEVMAGQILAITMRTAAGAHFDDVDDIPFVWNADTDTGENSGTYGGGRAFARGVSAAALTWGEGDTFSLANTDYSFRTFVKPVPEPSSFWMLTLGGLALPGSASVIKRTSTKATGGRLQSR